MDKPRSIFGPLLLIAIGAVWILATYGIIPSANLWALTHIWPYLLIAAGLGIILRPYWRYVNILLDILIIGGVLLSILFAPNLGWSTPPLIHWSDGDFYVGPGDSGSGNVITETRQAAGFHAVSVDYPARVLIRQGNAESVEIEAEDNLMPNLRTEVTNGALRIYYQRTGERYITPTKIVVVTVTVEELDEVDFSSAGDLALEGIKADALDISFSGAGNLELKDVDVMDLEVDMSGAGSMTASGAAENLDLDISGFGDFKGENLQCGNVRVVISGAGSATVWAESQLDAEISGAGSVNYYGSPDVTKEINGLGSVNRAGDK